MSDFRPLVVKNNIKSELASTDNLVVNGIVAPLGSAGGILSITAASFIVNIDSDLTVSSNILANNDLFVGNNTILGLPSIAGAKTLIVNALLDSDILLNTDNLFSLGSGTARFNGIHANIFTAHADITNTVTNNISATSMLGSSDLFIDSGATLQIGTAQATEMYYGQGGTNLHFDGNFLHSSGAFTATPNAASSLSVSSGSLTLNAASGLILRSDNTATNRLLLTTANITVQAGTTLNTTSTGNINLPNNGSSAFKIEGVVVGTAVTANNLSTLTFSSNSNADALHTHAGLGIFTAKEGEIVAIGQLVGIENSVGIPGVFRSIRGAAGNRKNAIGFSYNVIGSIVYILATGEITIPDVSWISVPTVSNLGDFVYMADSAGKVTVTAPGSNILKVGIVTYVDGSTDSTRIAIQIGSLIP